MTLPKIEERTLYPPIINYLDKIGFKAIGETKVIEKHPDILFKVNSTSFVVEVKIGKPDIGLKVVAQASDYARKLKTQNIVILIYPEKFRNQTILNADAVTQIALYEDVYALILTEYWTESKVMKASELFNNLKQQVLAKKVRVDFKTIVTLIETYVRELNSIVYQIKADELVSEVVDKLDLFSSIGDIKDPEVAKKQVMNLASYLLFNQLLFYHIYTRKTKNRKLAELAEIKSVRDIQTYFDMITEIDYQSIYRINILGHIPEKNVVIETLNEVIKALILLRAEHVTHDLAGRFFHDLIPFEVRKVLAAFYTHPIAAEILAGLTIDSWDDTVIDPACGSGTLLVSAYKKKMDLYHALFGFKNLGKIHKQFLEKDITGIDIMPFAAHITTINLTTQNIEEETNIVRIGCKDSLSLAKSLRRPEYTTQGVNISSYTEEFQHTLFGAISKKLKQEGTISPQGKGEGEFFLKPFDAVIMNPPFSDREKMPPYMREKLKRNTDLTNISGNQVNLWGYFLALGNFLLKPGGKIGAVIPVNIARGKATENIREFLIKNYCIDYIIKPIGDLAFSEGSAFKDVLFIARNQKPQKTDKTKIILLKQSIRDLQFEKVEELLSRIFKNRKINYVDSDLEIFEVTQEDLFRHKENLMYFLWASSINTLENSIEFLHLLDSDKLIKIKDNWTQEGFHASPAGLSELTFITRNIDESRIKRAFYILKSDNSNKIKFEIKDSNQTYEVSKSKTKPALRTITGVNTMDVCKIHDYIILDNFPGFKQIMDLDFSKWEKKNEFSWELVRDKAKNKDVYLAFSRRFNLYSPNTSLVAFYSENKFIPPDTLKIFTKFNKEDSKIICLFLNSIINLIQMFANKEETTGQYGTIRGTDLALFNVFDITKLSNKDKELLHTTFKKIKGSKFPSIKDQLSKRFSDRIELDTAILTVLGFSKKQINEWLPKIYDGLLLELNSIQVTG